MAVKEAVWIRLDFVAYDGMTPCHVPVVGMLIKETDNMFIFGKEATFTNVYDEETDTEGYKTKISDNQHPIFYNKNHVVSARILDEVNEGFSADILDY